MEYLILYVTKHIEHYVPVKLLQTEIFNILFKHLTKYLMSNKCAEELLYIIILYFIHYIVIFAIK